MRLESAFFVAFFDKGYQNFSKDFKGKKWKYSMIDKYTGGKIYGIVFIGEIPHIDSAYMRRA